MRHLVLIAATCVLAACETFPDPFAPVASTTGSSTTASTSSSASTATSSSSSIFRPPPQQQLLELERQLSASAQDAGLGNALASVIAPDGMVIRPGVTLSGADAIARGLTPPANAGPIYWQPDRVEVSGSGDMGMTSGRYVQVITGAEAQQGRYIVVWRRDGSGDWKILTETRVPDPPRARAAPARPAPRRR